MPRPAARKAEPLRRYQGEVAQIRESGGEVAEDEVRKQKRREMPYAVSDSHPFADQLQDNFVIPILRLLRHSSPGLENELLFWGGGGMEESRADAPLAVGASKGPGTFGRIL